MLTHAISLVAGSGLMAGLFKLISESRKAKGDVVTDYYAELRDRVDRQQIELDQCKDAHLRAELRIGLLENDLKDRDKLIDQMQEQIQDLKQLVGDRRTGERRRAEVPGD